MPDVALPLHPALVHLPVAFALLLPLLALVTAVAIARGWLPARSWALVVLLHVLLAGSAWRAEQAGHHDEERVEKIVPRDAIETHEERAERFVLFCGAALLVTAAGLLAGGPGGVARGAAVVLAAGLTVAAIRTGESGGALVYQHGAASAWQPKNGASAPPTDAAAGEHSAHRHEDGDERDEAE